MRNEHRHPDPVQEFSQRMEEAWPLTLDPSPRAIHVSTATKSSTFCRHRWRPRGGDGFTARELIAVLGALALLAAVAGPLLANAKLRSQRTVCVNNLARIGRASCRERV